MEYPEKKKQYNLQYKKDKMKRIPFDVRLEGDGLTYALLKAMADSQGEGVAPFIKKACIERIERIMRQENANDK